MDFIWGKSCRKCGKTATEGNYCKGCYECTFPVCNHCKKTIPDGEEKVGNCHKKPCYTDMTGNCCECLDKARKGCYCQRCYECTFPVCNHCKKTILDGEEKVGNCHKKPCYTDMTGNCCECLDKARKGCYCQRCYDSKYPPPATVEYSKKGTNVNLKVRTDQEGFESAMYLLGQGAAHGLQESNSLCRMLGLPPPWK